jgi:hypothetical protein
MDNAGDAGLSSQFFARAQAPEDRPPGVPMDAKRGRPSVSLIYSHRPIVFQGDVIGARLHALARSDGVGAEEEAPREEVSPGLSGLPDKAEAPLRGLPYPASCWGRPWRGLSQ